MMAGDDTTAGVTYRDAGVDIDAGARLAQRIGPMAKRTHTPHVLGAIGGFAGMVTLPEGMRQPVLVAACDGVGTKLKIANTLGRHATIGVDLVAMNVNDVICCGAEPLLFLDYISTGHLDVALAAEVVSGIVEGCSQAECALIGGETAEMPGMYSGGDYDLAGFVVGVVERDEVVDGSRVAPNDVVIGLPSSGLHSNGYSLARRVLGDDLQSLQQTPDGLGRSIGDELIEPTRIYVRAIKQLRRVCDVRALAHITGGGLVDNPPRVTPDAVAWRFDPERWEQPAVMRLIANRASVAVDEMRRTFNMGLGMLAVVPASQANAAIDAAGGGARAVGTIVERDVDPVEFIPGSLG